MVDWTTTKCKHGTNSGYIFHRKLGEEACDKCLIAHSKVSRLNFIKNGATPEAKIRAALNTKAQGAAKTELAQKHKEEYRKIYQKHKRRLEKEAARNSNG